jgi:hypothetical protein
MVTPPTPISVESYVKAGFPFFKEYTTDEGAEACDFDSSAKGLMTVQEIDKIEGIQLGDSVASQFVLGCMECKRSLCDCM